MRQLYLHSHFMTDLSEMEKSPTFIPISSFGLPSETNQHFPGGDWVYVEGHFGRWAKSSG